MNVDYSSAMNVDAMNVETTQTDATHARVGGI
jgi:hypothetical protein